MHIPRRSKSDDTDLARSRYVSAYLSIAIVGAGISGTDTPSAPKLDTLAFSIQTFLTTAGNSTKVRVGAATMDSQAHLVGAGTAFVRPNRWEQGP
jgi:hypothetical protein